MIVFRLSSLPSFAQYIPGISNLIDVKQVATPHTLVKYTSNYRGAMYGWASIPEQIGYSDLGGKLNVGGLFVVGHWSTIPGGHSGLSTVVASGSGVAKIVLKARKKTNISLLEVQEQPTRCNAV